MKKLLLISTLFFTLFMSSCDLIKDSDDDSKATVENPFSDQLEFLEVGCFGNLSTEEVNFMVKVKNIGSAASFYFGWIDATGSTGYTYSTASMGYYGTVKMAKDETVMIDYASDSKLIKNVRLSEEKFKSIKIDVSVNGSTKTVEFRNVNIVWE